VLRITVTSGTPARTAVALEGRLSGAWVDELARTLDALLTDRDGRSIDVVLDAVSYIDGGGKELLRALHRRGVGLRATGCMNRATVEEITGRKSDDDCSGG
jgi:hypothetical protein